MMNCQNCQFNYKCCKELTIPLGKVNEEEIRFLELRGFEYIKENNSLLIKKDCSKLKNNLCEIYWDRPKVCEDYQCK